MKTRCSESEEKRVRRFHLAPSGLVILFLCLAAWAVRGGAQGVKEGVAETVIKGVERREQLVKNIRSMKAVWHCQEDGALPREGAKEKSRQRVEQRELFLLEGEKERVEIVAHHNLPPGPIRTPGEKGQEKEGGVRMVALPSGTAVIFVCDGRSVYHLRRTPTGVEHLMGRSKLEPGQTALNPNMAVWTRIPSRFGGKPDSEIMREGHATAERLPGPPERYKLAAVRTAPQREKYVWWVAPEYGYAATRVEMEFFGLHPRRFVEEYKQFRELAPGVWLPHWSRELVYLPDANGKWELRSSRLAVAEEMKLNIDIPEHYFRLPETK